MVRLRETGAAAAGLAVLVRYRRGVVGETARSVHVVPLTTGSRAGAVRALCGTVLMLAEMDAVDPGEGMPCTACVLDRMSGAAEESSSGSPEGDVQEQGWPVIRRGAALAGGGASGHRRGAAAAYPY